MACFLASERFGLYFIVYIFLVGACLADSLYRPQQVFQQSPEQQSEGDRLGAVASENRECSQIGIDLLKAGGNAADAVRLSLRQPYSS